MIETLLLVSRLRSCSAAVFRAQIILTRMGTEALRHEPSSLQLFVPKVFLKSPLFWWKVRWIVIAWGNMLL